MVGFLAQTRLRGPHVSYNGPFTLCPSLPTLTPATQNTCTWPHVWGQSLPLDPGKEETPGLAQPWDGG